MVTPVMPLWLSPLAVLFQEAVTVSPILYVLLLPVGVEVIDIFASVTVGPVAAVVLPINLSIAKYPKLTLDIVSVSSVELKVYEAGEAPADTVCVETVEPAKLAIKLAELLYAESIQMEFKTQADPSTLDNVIFSVVPVSVIF